MLWNVDNAPDYKIIKTILSNKQLNYYFQFRNAMNEWLLFMAYGDVKSDIDGSVMHSLPMPAYTQARNMIPKQAAP